MNVMPDIETLSQVVWPKLVDHYIALLPGVFDQYHTDIFVPAPFRDMKPEGWRRIFSDTIY